MLKRLKYFDKRNDNIITINSMYKKLLKRDKNFAD